jgi:hypothetical protein
MGEIASAFVTPAKAGSLLAEFCCRLATTASSPISDFADLSTVVRPWPDEGGCETSHEMPLGVGNVLISRVIQNFDEIIL